MSLYRKILHPILINIVKNKDLPEITMINQPPEVSGNAIYVTNHQCVYDIPMAALAIPRHVYLLIGKQRLEVQDRLFFILNGSIWVDRKNKKSRSKSKVKMRKLLAKGESIVLFPEGTWNYYPHNLLLPLNWGCIELARECQVPIIPFAMDYRDGNCKIKWGEVVEIPELMGKEGGVLILEESLATLVWELCEESPVQQRKDVPDDWWENEWQRRVQEYPKLDVEYELSVARKKYN